MRLVHQSDRPIIRLLLPWLEPLEDPKSDDGVRVISF
jgi:hypothetical protein